MSEREWVAEQVPLIAERLTAWDESLSIGDGIRLPYTHEIRHYSENGPPKPNMRRYETDLLVREHTNDGQWKPRLIIEAKLRRINTHGAIAYSQKASTHKQVHPYLRYGILLGYREHYPLPGRLFRHGAHFDFMLSWRDFEPTEAEMSTLVDVIIDEVRASRVLEEIVFNSRSPHRETYTLLHRPLLLRQIEKGDVGQVEQAGAGKRVAAATSEPNSA